MNGLSYTHEVITDLFGNLLGKLPPRYRPQVVRGVSDIDLLLVGSTPIDLLLLE